MWMGELITDRGIGNGMSVVLFTSVLAVIPGEVEQAQRRIPVQYAKRMHGRRMYGGASTYLPVKVNQSGVVPVMFASSALYLPQLAASMPPVRPAVPGQAGDPDVPRGARQVSAGRYHAWLLPPRQGEPGLVIESAAPGGQLQDLVISGSGLSQPELLALVGAGLRS